MYVVFLGSFINGNCIKDEGRRVGFKLYWVSVMR